MIILSLRGAAVFLLVGTLSGGCTSAFRVSQDPDSRGLPFFLNSVVYRQHSLHEYGWLRVSLASAPILDNTGVAEKLGAPTTMVREIRDDAPNRAALSRLQRLIADLPAVELADLGPAIQNIRSAFDGLNALPPDHAHAPSSTELRLIGNSIERVSVVDYTRPYYLNAAVPIFGSSNLAAELSAQGTLAKGSNAATGGAAEAIGAVAAAFTGAIPLKEYLTSRWVPTRTDSAALTEGRKYLPSAARFLAAPRTHGFRYELTVEAQTRVFDFMADHAHPPTGAALAPLPADFLRGVFSLRAAPKPAAPEAPDGIIFSGQVRMPKAEGSSDSP